MREQPLHSRVIRQSNLIIHFCHWAVPLEIAATYNLVAHRFIDGNTLLADGEQRAKECDAEVVANVVLDAHNFLELHTPPYHKAARTEAS